MLFCSRCGKQIDSKYDFCIYCGNPVVKPDEQTNVNTESAAAPDTAQQAAPVPNAFDGGANSDAQYAFQQDAAQLQTLEDIERESTPLLVFSILALALPMNVNIVFAIIACIKIGSLSSHQLNFADYALADRYRAVMRKIQTCRTLVKVAFIVSGISAVIGTVLYMFYVFLSFFAL